jgi:hypothetical protein
MVINCVSLKYNKVEKGFDTIELTKRYMNSNFGVGGPHENLFFSLTTQKPNT